jgi:NitT/TauT family transport system permease protein
MIRRPINRTWRVGLGIASFVVVAVVYTALSQWQTYKNPSQTVLPGWGELARGVEKVLEPDDFEYDGQSWLWVDTKASLGRLFAGLLTGVGLGLVLGMAMGCYEFVGAFLLPPLAFMAKIPPVAIMAVFYAVNAMLAGVLTTEERTFLMFVGIIAFGVTPSLAQTVQQAAKKDVPDELIDKAFTLGASQPELIWNVIFKQVLPRLLEAIRMQLAPAMVYLIAVEWVETNIGFGYRMKFESRVLHMNVVYVYLIYLGLIGMALDTALTWTRRKLCPWFGE